MSPATGGLQEGRVVNAGQSPRRALGAGTASEVSTARPRPCTPVWGCGCPRGVPRISASAFQAIAGEAEAEPAGPPRSWQQRGGARLLSGVLSGAPSS